MKRHAPKGPLKARNQDPMPTSDPLAGRCTATSKQRGERCLRRAIPGGTVCFWHGGAAPQVMAKADERLRALELPALARLEELIKQTEFPSTAMAAVKDALDRIRGKAPEAVTLQHSGEVKFIHEVPE